jgi:xylulokinase
MAGGPFVLGYDFGTSALKAALFDSEGQIVASASEALRLLFPAPGWAEQRPEDWWTAMASVTRRVLAEAGASPDSVKALGMAAQMAGVVPVDANGAALSDCLIWLDMRSADIAKREFGGPVAGYAPFDLARWLRYTGGAPNLSGKDPPTKMIWLRERMPDVWARTYKLLDVKDYLLHRCTGNFVTSYDCAHLTWLFDGRTGEKRWSPKLLERLGLDIEMLPEVKAATDIAGGLTVAAAEALGLRAGIPVSVGTGDVSAATLAAGTPENGSAHLCIGTSSWFGAMVPKSRVNPFTGIGSISGADGKDYLLIATQENAGACVKWAVNALGFEGDFEAFEQAAGQARERADAPLFTPWMFGERVPIDDKHVRGGFARLSLDSGREDMARAIYEGVALNARWAMKDFDRLSERAGVPLRLIGGGARSALWCQIFADALQRPLERIVEPESGGTRGSAMTAAVVAGWYPDLAAASVMTRTARVFQPDPALADFYAARFAAFTRYYKRVKPWYARVAKDAPGRAAAAQDAQCSTERTKP